MKRDLDIHVAIIEDDETIREGYAYLIGNTPGYKIVGTYPSYEEAIKKIVKDDPDVLLLDVELPGISGVDALPKLKKLLPDTHILILTVYEQDRSNRNTFSARRFEVFDLARSDEIDLTLHAPPGGIINYLYLLGAVIGEGIRLWPCEMDELTAIKF